MKKIILGIAAAWLLMSSVAFGAWDIVPSISWQQKNYSSIRFSCTSDGSALTATDLLAMSNMPNNIKRIIQGSTAMIIKVVPGTGAAAPTTTIDITLSDDDQDYLFVQSGVSNVPIGDGAVFYRLDGTITTYLPIGNSLYLTINDIGDAADTVDLYIIFWNEGASQ